MTAIDSLHTVVTFALILTQIRISPALREVLVFLAAEFNIQVDPEAAKIVFDSGLVTMVPLEVTHTGLHDHS